MSAGHDTRRIEVVLTRWLFVLHLLQASTPSTVRRATAITAPIITPMTLAEIPVLWPLPVGPSLLSTVEVATAGGKAGVTGFADAVPAADGGEVVGPLGGLALGCWAAEEGKGGAFATAGGTRGSTAAAAAVMGARAGASWGGLMLFDTEGADKISRGGKTLAPGPSASLGAHSAHQSLSRYRP